MSVDLDVTARDRRVADSRPPQPGARRLGAPGAPTLTELVRRLPVAGARPGVHGVQPVIEAARLRRAGQ